MKAPFLTYSGQFIDLMDLKPSDIEIKDVAHHLSNLCRYNGATRWFYSVAEHSVLLARYARDNGYIPEVQLALLLHDASEAYVGDVVYHLKNTMTEFKELEKKIIEVIYDKYNIDCEKVCSAVNFLDRSICIDEMQALLTYVDPVLTNEDSPYRMLGVHVKTWAPMQAREEFLVEYIRIQELRGYDILI